MDTKFGHQTQGGNLPSPNCILASAHSGEVGQGRSEATLVVFLQQLPGPHESRKGQVKDPVASFRFRLAGWQDLGFHWMWAIIPFHVGQRSIRCGPASRCCGAAEGHPTGCGVRASVDGRGATAFPSVPSSCEAAPSSFPVLSIPSLPRRCRRSIRDW